MGNKRYTHEASNRRKSRIQLALILQYSCSILCGKVQERARMMSRVGGATLNFPNREIGSLSPCHLCQRARMQGVGAAVEPLSSIS